MKLAQTGTQLTGDFDGDKLGGTVTGDTINASATDQAGATAVELLDMVEAGVVSVTVEVVP